MIKIATDNSAGLLNQYLKLHNYGIKTGDFTLMLELFADNSEMIFENINAGPFTSKKAIADAFNRNPPDDTLIILNVENDKGNGNEFASYSWSKNPNKVAGKISIQTENKKIKSLTVTVIS